MKQFNTTGKCIPEKHYMVDISDRVKAAKEKIGKGIYFTINRGRQYGKTTLLSELRKNILNEYTVFSISFEGMGSTEFESVSVFARSFFKLLQREIRYGRVNNVSEKIKDIIVKYAIEEIHLTGVDFYDIMAELNSVNEKPVVLIIDEVDQAGNYDIFLGFLGILRDMYLNRHDIPAFHSVILAGVYDIKNLKLKIRDESEHQYNSPWNIADSFTVDMSFNKKDIETLLGDYESEHHSGMDTSEVAEEIEAYTSGYPFLVSRICQLIDQSSGEMKWDKTGVERSVKMLLNESNTLFDDMRKKIEEFPEMRSAVYDLLYSGKKIIFNIYNKALNIAKMFDFISQENGGAVIHNRIFETWLYNLFASEEGLKERQE